MFLSDRDLAYAIECNKLIFRPAPEKIDPSSIDMHLDSPDKAKIWNIAAFANSRKKSGHARPELNIGAYSLGQFGDEYLISPPEHDENVDHLVSRRGNEIIVRTGGFVLWPTIEVVGTNPDKSADLICFVDGKSTKARTGILVHFTAPTIHASWSGVITLEIANLGPFDIVLKKGDAISQLTVAKVTSPPSKTARVDSETFGQTGVDGRSE